MTDSAEPSKSSNKVAFSWPIRVYCEDTDAGGVVYHARYLQFMERARTEWLRELGFEQDRLRAEEGVVFVVRSVQMDFLKPALFNERLDVTCIPERVSRAKLTIHQEILRQQDLLVSARILLACVQVQRFLPKRIPLTVREVLESNVGDSAWA